jgi:hypothetical protein
MSLAMMAQYLKRASLIPPVPDRSLAKPQSGKQHLFRRIHHLDAVLV